MTMVPASTSPDFTIGRVCVGGLAAPTRPTDGSLPAPMLDGTGPVVRNKNDQYTPGLEKPFGAKREQMLAARRAHRLTSPTVGR
jgi:hypothetical protein